MRELIIPKGHLKEKIIENTKIRKIVRYTYSGRDIEAYYDPEGNLIGLKHICRVRIFHSQCPCYGFYENKYGQTYLELYTSFDSALLLKVLRAHYKDINLDDILIWPGSPYVVSTFSFLDPCIVIMLKDKKKRSLGKKVPLGSEMPVDYFYYY